MINERLTVSELNDEQKAELKHRLIKDVLNSVVSSESSSLFPIFSRCNLVSSFIFSSFPL